VLCRYQQFKLRLLPPGIAVAGLGGNETICASHMAAGVFGVERNLGNLITPLRACYNWAEPGRFVVCFGL
jgi:hypothetical protein